jgi:hypothetical protein
MARMKAIEAVAKPSEAFYTKADEPLPGGWDLLDSSGIGALQHQ